MGKFADELIEKFPDVFQGKPALGDYKQNTLAWVIQRVIQDIEGNPDLPQWGRTKMGRARIIQERSIGAVDAVNMTEQQIIDFLKERRRDDKIGPATALHDLSVISTAIDYHVATWREPSLAKAVAAITIAKKFAKKNRITGKANVRKRRPTDDEHTLLLARAEEWDKRPGAQIRLADFIAAAWESGRRRGELVRIKHSDVDYEKKFYWVRDIKHPTKKKGNDKRFVLTPALAILFKRQPRIAGDDRIFPFNGNSVGAAFCALKNELREEHPELFQNLRFHDYRRDCISRWLLKPGLGPQDVRLLVSGHDNTIILEKNYDGRDALEVARAKLPEFQQPTAA